MDRQIHAWLAAACLLLEDVLLLLFATVQLRGASISHACSSVPVVYGTTVRCVAHMRTGMHANVDTLVMSNSSRNSDETQATISFSPAIGSVSPALTVSLMRILLVDVFNCVFCLLSSVGGHVYHHYDYLSRPYSLAIALLV